MAGLACVLLAAAACSNGGDATSDSSASAPPEPQLSGDPVVIGSMFPVNATIATFPELPLMAQIAVKVVNGKGGIKGRPLKWVHCDDKGDPNVAATCANQLINQDKVVALVESVGLQGNVMWPVIKQANIINWFNVPIGPDDGTNPLSYPAGLGIYAHTNVGLLVKQGEFKKVRCVVSSTPLADRICGFAQSSLAAKGITDFSAIKFPAGTTAFQPYATKVVADGADAVVVVANDAVNAPILQALADAGADVTVLEPSTSIGSRSQAVAKSNKLKLRVGGSWGADAGKFPARKDMLDNIKKYGPSVGAPSGMDTTSDNAFNMYQGILSLAAVMNGAQSLSTADLQAYIAANPVVTGVAPPLDWSKPGPIDNAPRIVQFYATPEILDKDGGLVSESNTWSSSFPGVSSVTCCSK
ncbi:ABC transporter substrate-binding protein [Dactylosporangium sp. AC04546]|uniref:ABC transporter substrate-binding protein n=1 Tax=Dactylosporangium sp. AC04546 TaxID=2862460 RepID=UPI001EDE6A36|nr:ABC transporter substrate-binding protein [Dactylosporangium sp. AC04546]WVK86916.1 ABC transporter substrate-binding protein [Dactylosporangium sp. AC04546]